MSTTVLPFAAKRSRAAADSESTTRGGEAIWPVLDLPDEQQRGEWLASVIDGQPFEHMAVSLWTHHPNLRTSAEKLASFITPNWPSESGDPLLATAVKAAILNAEEAVSQGQAFQGMIVGKYLDGLLSVHESVGRLDVRGQDRDGQVRRWDHFALPLLAWARGHGIDSLVVSKAVNVTDTYLRGIRTHMLAAIATPVDAGYHSKFAARG